MTGNVKGKNYYCLQLENMYFYSETGDKSFTLG